MAIKIASAGEIAGKWIEVTPGRAQFYQANTPAAAEDWQRATEASVQNFTAAVTAGNIGARFLRGVREAGAAKYARKVKEVGANRFATGVQAAKSDFQSGFEPYAQLIAGLTLPQRRPRGDPANIQRVQIVAQELSRRRLASTA